ncbi:MAG TPA: polyprenyl synthetase family protein [Bacteroidales bacterium]|nr:polyprenyl synthetase family protein [Bacteroidales bacterium]
MDHKHYQSLVDEVIDNIHYPPKPALIYEPIRYTLANGGKRLRPVLALMSCDLTNGNCQDTLYPAVSLELLHNFTLIHDDIMDQAPLRRGKETVHCKWGTNVAILSGDALFSMAYDYLAKTNSAAIQHLLKTFNRIAVQICEGQQFDMDFENHNDVSIDEYIEMIRLKTAVFFGGCMQIGAIAGGASNEIATLLYNHGENLGIAFQLQDDILDAFGSEKQIGKKIGGDIAANKKTFLYLKALQLADNETSAKLRYLYSTKTTNEAKKIDDVLQIFTQVNVRRHAEDLMDQYYQAAMFYLDRVAADTEKKKIFSDFVLRLIDRDR